MMHIGSWELDLVTDTLTWSDEIYRIFEIDPDGFAASYKAFLEAVHPDDRDRVDKAYRDSLKGRTPYAIDYRLLMPDGRIKHVHEQCETTFDDAGRPLRSRGTVQDITTWHEAEVLLAKNEARLKEAQEVAQIGSWELDLATNALWWSEKAFRIFGFEPGAVEATYQTFLDAVHPEDRDWVAKVYESSVANKTPYSIEHRLAPRDGAVKWVHERCETFYDEDGRPVRSVGTTQDITERKQAEAAASATRKILEHVEDAAGLGVWEFYPRTGLMEASEADQVLHGLDPMTGPRPSEDFLAVVHPEDRERFIGSWQNALEENTENHVTYRTRIPGGEVRWFESHGWPFHRDDETPYVGFTQDITERKEKEDLERREKRQREEIEFRARFVNMAAHEMNQPLTPLNLHLGLLRAEKLGPLNDKQRQIVTRLERNLSRMILMVRDMLDSARLQAGSLQLRPADMDLGAVLTEAVATYRPVADEQGIRLGKDLDPDLALVADPQRIEQVVSNLINNAVKFTSEGEVEVRGRNEDGTCVVEVLDTGIGLTEEQQASLFEPFTQVHEEPPPGGPRGTGLGLYISKGIIEAHGGTFGVESAGAGKGSRFWFRLPRDG